LPVLLPAVAWPAQYAAILRELGVLSASASLALSARLGVFAAWLVLAGWSFVRGGARRVDAAAEWLCLLLLQWSLPPLGAFTVYFCALHGPRHMRGLGRSTADRQTIVVSAAAVAILAGAAWVAASWHHAGLIWAGTNGIFWGLAALTLPHVIFGRLAAWLAGRDQGGFDASRGS
jgi:Brp/Blh family beta-carotene 15,15'-monooxygenase